MPLVGAAAVAAGGAIAGGVIASKAQGKAVKAQEAAAKEAIAYEERRQAAAKAERIAAAKNWQKRYDAYLEKFYGWKPPGSEGGGGASTGAVPGGAIPAGVGQAGVRSQPYGQGDNIAALMQNMGQMRSGAALASGNMWGDTLTQAGAGIGQAIKNRPPAQQATLTGQMQPTGVAQPGISPWQPAPMPRGPQDDWSNWQRYYGNPGV